jgi:prophage regulatory protein
MKMRYLRRDEVCLRTGLSISTVERLERTGDFPARRQLSPRSVGWLEIEIQDWIDARPRVVSSVSGAGDRV